MNRREALAMTFGGLAWNLLPRGARALGETACEPAEFVRVAGFIRKQHLSTKPLDNAIVAIGKHFLGTPYVGGTLEVNPIETCVINFQGLDCVTFFELSLDLARIAKKNTLTYDALINEVTFTRYRNGTITDYTSRLHYTTDWFDDNERKGVVKNITGELGGIRYSKTIDFMSTHPDKYRQLREDASLIAAIRAAEHRLAQEKILFIPKEQVAAIEDNLADGDIIGITTTIPGIDCSHTGLIVREGEHARFLHASSIKKLVIIADGSLSDYLNGVPKHTGIMVVRPVAI